MEGGARMMLHNIATALEMDKRRGTFFFSVDDAARASDARSLFSEYLAFCCDSDFDYYSAELIFGELTGNVVQHAPGPLIVSVAWKGGRAVLEVWDRGPGYDLQTAFPSDDVESHRGLAVVAVLGQGLRVNRRGEYTVTSVILPVREGIVAAYAVNP
jgi:anti-sigma regulatory factor (Ser/Thr protein kinase)